MMGPVRGLAPRSYHWQRWYAWRPVYVVVGNLSRWVWLEWVERRFENGYDDMYVVYYRLIK